MKTLASCLTLIGKQLFTLKTKTMKNFFTLIVALALFTAAGAQRGHKYKKDKKHRYHKESNIVIGTDHYNRYYDYYGDHHNRYGYYDRYDRYDRRSMQWEIDRINRKYDHRIHDVWDDHHMRPREKRRMVRHLEQERREELRRVYDRNRNRSGVYGRIHIHF